jgi:hypothetical protein
MLRHIARRLLQTQPEPIQAAARTLFQEIRLARAVRHAGRQFAALDGAKDLKLHLGCGSELKSGWLNVDLNLNGTVPEIDPGLAPDTRFILYDLRSGKLPLADESCSIVYSSHFLEHLEYRQGLRLMRDCHRVLQPQGTFRAGLPAFRQSFRKYVDGDHAHFNLYSIYDVRPELDPATTTLVDHINYGVYQNGEHKFIYDEEKICLVLRSIGFGSVSIAPYREGLDPSSELRQRYSFYVEAIK